MNRVSFASSRQANGWVSNECALFLLQEAGLLTFLADGAFIVHGFFVVLILPSVALALTGFYNPRPIFWHLHNLSIAVMVTGQLYFGQCPLVELEQMLRASGGQQMPYGGSYVEYLVNSVSGLTMPDGSVAMLSTSVVILTLLAATWHWRAIFRSPLFPSAEASAI